MRQKPLLFILHATQILAGILGACAFFSGLAQQASARSLAAALAISAAGLWLGVRGMTKQDGQHKKPS